jgi:prepilin-type N-terminal cleavage/methylation domain-containing protein
MTRSSQRRRQGFTLIEVMISLLVMTVGVLPLLALHSYGIRSNTHARQMSIALSIAERWVDRFQQDAHTWNQVGVFNVAGQPNDAVVLANTTYLRQIVTTPNVYQTIGNVTPLISNAFDYRGNDVANVGGNTPIFFCASFRPAWVYYGRAMRVDVRIWWAREGSDLNTTFPGCADDNVQLNPGPNTLMNNYHVVYLPTVIRVVPLYN